MDASGPLTSSKLAYEEEVRWTAYICSRSLTYSYMLCRLFIGSILAFDSLAATMGSSIFSAATTVVAAEYEVSPEVGTLATSLFVLGYAFGPLVWAPMVR